MCTSEKTGIVFSFSRQRVSFGLGRSIGVANGIGGRTRGPVPTNLFDNRCLVPLRPRELWSVKLGQSGIVFSAPALARDPPKNNFGAPIAEIKAPSRHTHDQEGGRSSMNQGLHEQEIERREDVSLRFVTTTGTLG